MARPPKYGTATVARSIRLTPQDWEALDAAAAANGWTVADVIRRLMVRASIIPDPRAEA